MSSTVVEVWFGLVSRWVEMGVVCGGEVVGGTTCEFKFCLAGGLGPRRTRTGSGRSSRNLGREREGRSAVREAAGASGVLQ